MLVASVFALLFLLSFCLLLSFLLPQFFCFREQAQKHYSPIFVGLIRYQIVEILDVA